MEKLKKYLKSKNIRPNLRGYYYTLTAVEIIRKTKIKTNIQMMKLYAAVAERHETKPSKVERNIRNLIAHTETRMTNGQFLFTWAEVEE